MIFSDNFILNIYEVDAQFCTNAMYSFFDDNYWLYFLQLLLIYIFSDYTKYIYIHILNNEYLQQIDIAAEHIDYTNAWKLKINDF